MAIKIDFGGKSTEVPISFVDALPKDVPLRFQVDLSDAIRLGGAVPGTYEVNTGSAQDLGALDGQGLSQLQNIVSEADNRFEAIQNGFEYTLSLQDAVDSNAYYSSGSYNLEPGYSTRDLPVEQARAVMGAENAQPYSVRDTFSELANNADVLNSADSYAVSQLDRNTLSVNDAALLGNAENSAEVVGANNYVIAAFDASQGVVNSATAEVLSKAQNGDQLDWIEEGLLRPSADPRIVEGDDFDNALDRDGAVDDLYLYGGDGDDQVIGGSGNDIIRGGSGKDEMEGGPGDDEFLVVGDLSAGGKVTTAKTTELLGRPLGQMNGLDLNEDANGSAEAVRGGSGDDTLHVFGDADLSAYQLEGIENLKMYSDVTLTPSLISQLSTVSGDGKSVLRLRPDNPGEKTTFSIKGEVSNIGQIDLDRDVTLEVDRKADLGGATVLTGEGTISDSAGALGDGSGYTLTNNLKVEGGNPSKATKVDDAGKGKTEGSAGDDYLTGTTGDETFDSKAGNDLISGKDGDDVYRITASGDKTIIDGDGSDTLNLSGVQNRGADINLGDGGGTIGDPGNPWATVHLGFTAGSHYNNSGIAQREQAGSFNVMPIVDTSGSMSYGRMAKAKEAVRKLFDTYDDTGNVAVRLVEFNSGGNAAIQGANAWTDLETARDQLDSLSAGGGTDYISALDTAESAFEEGQGDVFFEGGKNDLYFISDGAPNRNVGQGREDQWVDFLKQNDITARAIAIDSYNLGEAMDPAAYDGANGQDLDAESGVDSDQLANELKGQAARSQSERDFMENVIGTGSDDTLTGNSLTNWIEGRGGDDTLKGMGSSDVLNGGTGSDVAVFQGHRDDYRVTEEVAVGESVDAGGGSLTLEEGDVTVEDLGSGSDGQVQDGGINVLKGINEIRFEGGGGPIALEPEEQQEAQGTETVSSTIDLKGAYAPELLQWENNDLYYEEELTPIEPNSIPLVDANLPTGSFGGSLFGLEDTEVETSFNYQFQGSVKAGFPLSVDLSGGEYKPSYSVDASLDVPKEIKPGETIEIGTAGEESGDPSLEVAGPSASLTAGAEFGLDIDQADAFAQIDIDGPTEGMNAIKRFGPENEDGFVGYDRDLVKLDDGELTGAIPEFFDVSGDSSGTKSFPEDGNEWLTLGWDLSAIEDIEGKGGEDLGAKVMDDAFSLVKGSLGQDDGTVTPNPLSATGISSDPAAEMNLDLDDALGSIASTIGSNFGQPQIKATGEVLKGLDQEIQMDDDWLPDWAGDWETDMEFNLASADFNTKFLPAIQSEFNPDGAVQVELETSWGQSKKGALGDSFEFDVPESYQGDPEVNASLQLGGDVGIKPGVEVSPSLDLALLGYEGKLAGFQLDPYSRWDKSFLEDKGGILSPEDNLVEEPITLAGDADLSAEMSLA